MTDCKFISGEIPSLTENANRDLQIGATAIFEGTVRADNVNGKKVVGIEFSTHEDIAYETASLLLKKHTIKHNILGANIYHRIDFVEAGAVCFKVTVYASHRKEAFAALPEIVDDFKASVPIFGKEIYDDNSYDWKQNT